MGQCGASLSVEATRNSIGGLAGYLAKFRQQPTNVAQFMPKLVINRIDLGHRVRENNTPYRGL